MYIWSPGIVSNINEIKKIGKKFGIKVVQDGAQSLGATYYGQPTGANTEISTMSFHVAKILSCVEGGMLFTNSKKYRDEIIMRRSHGEKKSGNYLHNILGTNARITDMQAAIGLAQFKKLKFFIKKRKEIAKIYDSYFSEMNKIILPKTNKNCTNSYFFYPILIKNRDQIAKTLRKKYGIDTRIAYRMPIYKQKMYKSKNAPFRKLDCRVSERVTDMILNLPIYPLLRQKEILYIVNSIKKEISST